MGIFRNNNTLLSGVKEARDEKFNKGFKKKCIIIALTGLIGGPYGIYYFMFPDSALDITMLYTNITRIEWGAFFSFYIMIIVAVLCAILYSWQTYLREKGSRRGEEHGSSKLMTPQDMPRFRQGFFFDPKVVEKCKGYEDDAKKTYFDKLELKKMIRKTKSLENEYKKYPLKPLKNERERRLHKNSPAFQCFMGSQIMAQDVYVSMNCKYINRNLNTITVGGSGQGKSFSELFPNIMLANSNYVITDPSGEILQKCGKFLRSQGYVIKVFNVKDFNMSMRYNPLMYVESDADINILVDALNKNIAGGEKKSGGANQFFDDAQMALTAALFSSLREIYPDNPEKQTFFNVMELLRMAEQKTDPKTGEQYSSLDNVFDALKAKNPRSYAVKMYENFKVGGPKVCGSVIVSATAVFGRYFDNDDMAKLVEADDLNLYDFVTGVDENGNPLKCALFLIIPQDTTTYNFMVSMIYSQLFSIVTKGGERWRMQHNTENPALPRHLSFWLDEFANVGKIPSFVEVLSVVRKYNISINIIIQSLSQLKAGYKDTWEVIIGNCDTLIYLGGQEPSSIKTMVEKLGKETIKTHSASQSYGNKGSSSSSQQYTGREVLTASEIEQMSRAYELVFITGCKPFQVRKYDLTGHPNYTFFGEADPKNNMNIEEFNFVADDGKSGEQFRCIPMWYSTGRTDEFNVSIMERREVLEELLDNEDRLIRIDGNTISKDGIISDVSNVADRTFSVEKKVRMLKEQWKKAESEKIAADTALSKLKHDAADGSSFVPKEEIIDAEDLYQNAAKAASEKHLIYLEYKLRDIADKLKVAPENSSRYTELCRQKKDAEDEISREKDNLMRKENGEKEEQHTKAPIDLRSLSALSINPNNKLKEMQRKALERLNKVKINESFEDGIKELFKPGVKVIGIDGSGYDPAADFVKATGS